MITGLQIEVSTEANRVFELRNAHAVVLRDDADMVGSSDSAADGRLLLVVCEALAGEVGSAALGDLDDNRGLDVSDIGSVA